MKTIENKTTTIPKDGETFVTYADLFTAVLNKPVEALMPLKDMRRDIKLIDKMEEATDSIELTDEDFTHLAKLVEDSKWAIKHKDLVTFGDYVESLA